MASSSVPAAAQPEPVDTTNPDLRMRFNFFNLKLFVAVAEAGISSRRRTCCTSPRRERARAQELGEGPRQPTGLPREHRFAVDAAGVAALPYARRLLALGNRLRDDVAQYGVGAKRYIRLHSISVAATECLPAKLSSFLVSHPQVNVVLEERITDEILRAVREEAADVQPNLPREGLADGLRFHVLRGARARRPAGDDAAARAGHLSRR